MRDSLLVADHVSHTYGTGHTAVRALESVCLAFSAGQLSLVIGPSGSGKTTLLSVLGCLLSPTSGEVQLMGQAISGLPESARVKLRRRHIGFVFQASRLFRALSALENVGVALDIAGRSRQEARRLAAEALESVGLADKLNRRPHELSGGEKQRVAIARALVTNPEILFADEPTASLDGTTGRQIAELLRQLAEEQNKVVVVVSHDPRLAPFARRIITLEDGRLVGVRNNLPVGGFPCEVKEERDNESFGDSTDRWVAVAGGAVL